MLAVAIKDVFRTALTGRCASHQELADSALPLELHIPALPCRGGTDLARRVFEPWAGGSRRPPVPLDPTIPGLGRVPLPGHPAGRHRAAGRRAQPPLRAAAGPRRRQALLGGHRRGRQAGPCGRRLAGRPPGEGADHPPLPGAQARAHQGRAGAAGRGGRHRAGRPGQRAGRRADRGRAASRPVPLAEQRRGAVLAVIRAAGARRVGDFGCGEGVLVRDLLADPAIEQVVATDVSARALQFAARKLRLDRMSEPQRERLRMFQSSLTYRDDRLAGLDAAVLMEVIEHIDPPRLAALERVVFGHAAPATVIVTTPNVEYNVRFETLPPGTLRHRDHRFEWTRGQFRDWAGAVAAAHGYGVRFLPVGDGRPGGRPADADGGLRQDHARSRRATRMTGARGAGAEPRRPHRGQRLGQVDVRPRALQADRGDLVRLLPRPGGRRRERPVRHRRGVRAAPLHRRQAAGGRAADRRGRHQRAARRAPRAGGAGPRARRAAGRHRARRAGERLPRAQRRAARTATSAPT